MMIKITKDKYKITTWALIAIVFILWMGIVANRATITELSEQIECVANSDKGLEKHCFILK